MNRRTTYSNSVRVAHLIIKVLRESSDMETMDLNKNRKTDKTQ